ncbi:MAG: type I glyceraldehyde-3-phosphate dehydrogenase [Saprospiraceae bacterium]|nr:type I glyceraldehyde-3-phosphate dehydrogenase [Saprospiraceae bacterium]
MIKKIAINGFGRIGRLTLRHLIKRSDVEIVAINDLTKTSILAHLFEYDSTQGQYNGTVGFDEENIIIDGKKIPAFSNRNPEELPWGELEVDVVLECTGFFRKREQAQLHVNAGAKKVLLSAPSRSEGVPTIVMGVNDSIIQDSDWLLSNASCTTNCLAPLVKVIDREWGIKHGFMSTVHSYTANQCIQDGPHKDLRRARAAAINMLPTTTGAAKALAQVLPLMKGKISASSIRVPIPTGSLVELICVLERDTSAAEVNAAFKTASQADLKGVLEYSEKPLVSTDIVSNTHSSIFDSLLTSMHHGMLKVTSWYDNEAGYSARLAEMAMML